MISCTEFIPAYSELFKFIDEANGRQAVYDFWNSLFQPENSPLNHLIPKYGKLDGCWENWYVVFTEEACDNTMLQNNEKGWHLGCMHHCPSKGRFKKLGYMEPFEEYCKHCDSYEIVLGKYGLKTQMDYRGNEDAKCRSIIWDPEVFKGDPQEVLDKMYQCELEGCKFPEHPELCPLNPTGTKVLHTQSAEYKYLHRDFHNSMALGLEYIAQHYGQEGLRAYLKKFALAFHKPLLAKIKETGLAAVAAYFNWLYTEEEASDALEMAVSQDSVDITIHYCPAVKHLKSRDREVYESFGSGTTVLYDVIAEISGLGFELISYDHDTGAAKFRFFK